MAMNSAIFLDKDGTVLQDVPYNVNPEKMSFAPGARRGLARLARLNIPLIVISNQPGVALGKFDLGALGAMQQRLRTMFEEAGALLDGFYFCPHHPEGVVPAYTARCDCRKPAAGLLHIAAAQGPLDLERSWLVGDILDDIEAGRRAGCRTVLIDNGNETEWVVNEWRRPDYSVPDFDVASRIVVEHCSSPGGES